MRKSLLYFLILLLYLVFVHSSSLAAPNDQIIEESFNSRTMIDEDNTDAVVDTLLGEVKLPKVQGGQSFGANEDGILVAGNGRVNYYSFDGNEFVYNQYLSHTSTNPIAVALSPVNFEHYVLHADGTLTTYRFSNGYLHQDPAYKLSGFKSALSVAKSDESLFILDNREIKVYKDLGDGLIEVSMLNTKLDIDNPVQVASTGEDLVVLDEHGQVHFYRYTGNAYVKDPAASLLGVGTAIGAKNGGIYSVKENKIDAYNYTGSELVRNEYLSFSQDDVLSVAGLQDDWTVFVRDTNKVTQYMFTGDSMVQTNYIFGLDAPYVGYLSPRQMQTKKYTWSEGARRLKLELDADIPENTEIEIFVSPTGSSFTKVEFENQMGVIVFPHFINSLVIKAILKTDNPAITPVLKRIRVVDKSLDIEYLETTRIVRNPIGNPPLPTKQPVRVMGGYNFEMLVKASGAVKVEVIFSNGESLLLNQQEGGDFGDETFIGIHHFPLDAIGIFDAHVLAWDEDGRQVDKLFPAHYFIDNNITINATIYDIR